MGAARAVLSGGFDEQRLRGKAADSGRRSDPSLRRRPSDPEPVVLCIARPASGSTSPPTRRPRPFNQHVLVVPM